MISEHSTLLAKELKADRAQRLAIVRDDKRNLVIAGAGSGKTRTIVGRIRFLLERRVSPAGILAVTFTNKATEEMEERLRKMAVPLADDGREGITVSTLRALGKRIIRGAIDVRPYRDQWKIKLDAQTVLDRRPRVAERAHESGTRELRPRTPPALEPRVLTDETAGS